MRYASVCDGIGAAHQAWGPLGWECAWTSEIDPFPIAVVDHRWGLPNLGDMTKIQTRKAIADHGRIQLLVGGTPCPSFSVAGLRGGLDDPRGDLALVFLGLADQLRPEWVVWENVPGVLSSWSGDQPPSDLEEGQEWEGVETNDFRRFLASLEKRGYGWAYRVLDAQYVRVQSHSFAVPQSRRRVFVVAHIGGWQRAAAVLFEREGMRGHHPPSRITGQGLAPDSAGCSFSGSGSADAVAFKPCTVQRQVAGALSPGAHPGSYNGQDAYSGHLIPQPFGVANCMTGRMWRGMSSQADEGQTPVVAFDTAQITNKDNRSNPKPGDPCHTLASSGHPPTLAFTNNGGDTGLGLRSEHTPPMTTINSSQPNVCQGRDGSATVRRLMPIECERLQGFPDNYTLVPYRGSMAKDTPRYQALGNSMAVNVMSWIGQRIEAVHGFEENR